MPYNAFVTPDELKQWRASLGWTQPQAAQMLGLSLRAYKYLEQRGRLSGDGPAHDDIPLTVELAVCELRRRHRLPARQSG